MDIKEIIKMYGKVDYYDWQTGRIFHLSQMYYNEENNKTIIPVSVNGSYIGNVKMEGDCVKEKKYDRV